MDGTTRCIVAAIVLFGGRLSQAPNKQAIGRVKGSLSIVMPFSWRVLAEPPRIRTPSQMTKGHASGQAVRSGYPTVRGQAMARFG